MSRYTYRISIPSTPIKGAALGALDSKREDVKGASVKVVGGH